jgi:protein transport protein SEC61 subunit alpha
VQFQGAVIYFLHSLITKKNKATAFFDGMFREHAPNMSNVLATVLIFFIVIYFNGFRHDIKLIHTQLRGHSQIYPIKLFYTSSIPIFLLSLVVTAIMGFSQVLYRQFRGYAIVNLLGKWQEINGVGVPISGLAYFISPPRNIIEFLRDPVRSLFYTCFVLVVCASLSRLYIMITGENGTKLFRHFKAGNLRVMNKDRDEEAIKMLNKYTSSSSILGGLCVGMLTILAELLGALGGGTGLLLCASILTKFVENFFTENKRKAEME